MNHKQIDLEEKLHYNLQFPTTLESILKSMPKTAFLSMFFDLHMTFNIAALVSQGQVFKKQVSKV